MIELKISYSLDKTLNYPCRSKKFALQRTVHPDRQLETTYVLRKSFIVWVETVDMTL